VKIKYIKIADFVSCLSIRNATIRGALIFGHQFLALQRADIRLSQMVEVKNWADVAGRPRLGISAGVSAKLRPSYFGLSAESVEYKSSQRRGLFVNHPGARVTVIEHTKSISPTTANCYPQAGRLLSANQAARSQNTDVIRRITRANPTGRTHAVISNLLNGLG
jgi:hypothetical protein